MNENSYNESIKHCTCVTFRSTVMIICTNCWSLFHFVFYICDIHVEYIAGLYPKCTGSVYCVSVPICR